MGWSGGESGSEDIGSVLNGEQTISFIIRTVTSVKQDYTCFFKFDSSVVQGSISVSALGKVFSFFYDLVIL